MSTATIAATRAVALQSPRADASPQSAVPVRENAGQTTPTATIESAPVPASLTQNGTSRPATVLPMAPFVAQLIATHQALPQTRARNRAEPAAAAFAYRDTGRRAGS